MSLEQQKSWCRKRTTLLILGLIHQCLCHFEIAAVSISLLRYYKEILKVENAKTFYGFAMSALFISAVISSKLCGIYMDKTRNLRRIAFVTILFAVLGNFLYSLPFSKWLPVLGRFLCGVNEGLRTAIIGELSRVYEKETMAKHFTLYEAISAFAVLFGPLSPLLFKGLNTHIGFLVINQYNAVTIVLGVISGLLWVVCLVCLPNLTLGPEFEMIEKEIGKEGSSLAQSDGELLTTKGILGNFHLSLLLLSEGILSYNYFQTELLTNMIAIYDFTWGLSTLAKLYAVCFALTFLLMMLTQKFIVNSSINIYFLYISCFVLIAIAHSLINMIIALEINGTIIQMVLFGAAILCHLFEGYGSTAYSRWLLFALSPSHSASIVESHRYIIARSCSFIGFFTSGFVFPNLWFVLPLYNVVCYIVAGSMLINKKQILDKCEEEAKTEI